MGHLDKGHSVMDILGEPMGRGNPNRRIESLRSIVGFAFHGYLKPMWQRSARQQPDLMLLLDVRRIVRAELNEET